MAFIIYIILFLSGFAGLGYESVWTRMFSVGLGHEIISVLAVVTAFFSGCALGSWVLHKRVSSSAAPGRWYAALEIATGLWSLMLIPLIPWSNRHLALLISVRPSSLQQWALSFLIPFLILLPATFAMGGTLPAIERLLSRMRQEGWIVGGLYAANTLGAVVGTIVATFFIIPAMGYGSTQLVLACVNFCCGLGVLLWPAQREDRYPAAHVEMLHVPPSQRLLLMLFATGFLGIGYEVLVVRVASQIFEGTVYSFAALLAVYLLGTSAGAAAYQRLAPHKDYELVLAHLLAVTASACLFGMILLAMSFPLHARMLQALSGGASASVVAETATAFFIFFLPTAAMGALFSHLAQGGCAVFGGLGRALSVNTFGAALAPFSFGVILLPALGSKASLLLVSVFYLLLLPPKKKLKPLEWAVPTLLTVALILGPFDFRFVTLPPGFHVAAHIDGVMAAVTVVSDPDGDMQLRIDDKFVMGGTSSYYSDRRQGHIPLLLHPNPKRALFLGLGTGATFAAAAEYPGLEADGVELVPETVPLLHFFEKSTGRISKNRHLHIFVADARRFVRASPHKYDVVVADLFHPARDGSGSLYTAEHFEAIRALLNPGGVFCQWLPLYQMDLRTLRVITRTFLRVFPDGSAFLAHYSLQNPIVGLVAGGPSRYPAGWMQQRLKNPDLGRELKRLRLDTDFSLLGNFVAGARELAAFAGPGLINSDDRPVVTFEAPQFVYSRPGSPAGRLVRFIDAFHPAPDEILRRVDKEEGRRLAAYWAARNDFLRAGLRVTLTEDAANLLDQIRGVLLASLRKSPDFEPAYYPLLAMAERIRTEDPKTSWEVLTDLESAVPQRPEARELRDCLFSAPYPRDVNHY